MVPGYTRSVSDGMLVLQIAEGDGECTIVLRGELDLANAGTVETELEGRLANGASIVVDMRELEFIDSTGIALLVRAIQSDGSDDRLRFIASTFDPVNKVLELTGVAARMVMADPTAAPSG